MNFRYSILSNKEREKILNSLLSEKNIAIDFSLTDFEINKISKFQKPYISLGYALQYLFLKNRDILIVNSYDLIPEKIIDHVADQLNCNSKRLNKYWNIKNTKSKHTQDIIKGLGYKKFELNSDIEIILYNITLSFGSKFDMMKKLIEELHLKKVVLPTISTLEEVISKAIMSTDNIIYKQIYNQIENKDKLEDLLTSEKNGISSFSRIKNTSVNISSNGVKELLKLIKEINDYEKTIDLSFLSDNKISYFNTQIQQSHKMRIERFKDEYKKYSYLAMFLYFKKKEFMDMVIEVTLNHIHMIQKRSKKKTQEYNAKNQVMYKSDRERFKEVVKDLLGISDFNEFMEYQNTDLMIIDKELSSHEYDLDEVDFLLKSYQSIDYINELLEVIEFDSNTKPKLVKFLKSYRHNKTRKNNKIDISFFDQKWQKNIKKYDYSKKVIGMTVMHTIRDSIRSGDLFVRDSKKYNSFDHYLISPVEYMSDT
ncbi:DUF4158 domain-containing protein [Clostridioides sp. ES-S-0123-01]|uniref:DUF4158 domain-containing protein n=1 Tax=Clostridioides sp. ES-S-0123-01 TaxID=2770783 RepID=UPI001D11B998|nr:DUF4158 domain-containing protein [Clostridioides sp. ES-S-0123-01]